MKCLPLILLLIALVTIYTQAKPHGTSAVDDNVIEPQKKKRKPCRPGYTCPGDAERIKEEEEKEKKRKLAPVACGDIGCADGKKDKDANKDQKDNTDDGKKKKDSKNKAKKEKDGEKDKRLPLPKPCTTLADGSDTCSYDKMDGKKDEDANKDQKDTTDDGKTKKDSKKDEKETKGKGKNKREKS